MAARLKHRFYVYSLGEFERPAYVGKGSGNRLSVQRKAFGLDGRAIATFAREKDAYAFERVAIADLTPALNRHPGGNGSTAARKRLPRREQWEIEIEQIGSRRYAAKMLLRKDLRPFLSTSKIEQLRQVANG